MDGLKYPSSVKIREDDSNLLSDQLALNGQSPMQNVEILNESSHVVSDGHISETEEEPDDARRMFMTRSIKEQALNNFAKFK